KGTPLSEPFRVRLRPREPLIYAVLAIGGAPANFELPKPASGDIGPLRGGRVELPHVGSVADLPDQWIGYDAIHLLVLNTGAVQPEFLRRLFASDKPEDVRRREALFEWVRRGGRLVVSVGANAATVASLPNLAPVLPFAVAPEARTVDSIGLSWATGSGQTNT